MVIRIYKKTETTDLCVELKDATVSSILTWFMPGDFVVEVKDGEKIVRSNMTIRTGD